MNWYNYIWDLRKVTVQNVEKTGNFVQKIEEHVVYRAELDMGCAPLSLRSVGRAVVPNGRGCPVRKTTFTHVVWGISGAGEMTMGGHKWIVRKDNVIVCPASPGHSLRCVSGTEWVYRWFTLDGPVAAILPSSFNFPHGPFRAGPCQEELFEQLEKMLLVPTPEGERLAGAEAYRVMSLLAGLAAQVNYGNARHGADAVLPGLLPAGIDPGQNVQELADTAGVTRFSIHRAFRDKAGTTPKRYLDSLRLQKALSLLRECDLSISEIAMQTGFGSANYFAKFFRKKTGLTPTRFREEKILP